MSRWNKIKAVGLMVAFSFFPFLTIYADDVRSLKDLKMDMTHSEVLHYLDRFTSKLWVPSSWLGFNEGTLYLFNSFVQAIFWFNKILFRIFSEIYRQLSGGLNSQFDDYIQIALDTTSKVYKGVTGTSFLAFAGSMMASYVAYIYFVKNGSFFKTLLKFLLIYACTTILFVKVNGNYVIQNIYNGMNTIASDLASTGIKNVTFPDDGLDDSSLTGSSTDSVLRKYFSTSVWEPYVHMNSEVGADNELTDSQLLSLLAYDSGNNDFQVEGTKRISDFVGEGDNVKRKRLSTDWGPKFTYALFSLVDTTVLGVILNAFAVMSFANKMLILILLLSAGFVSLISLIPTFENALFNYLKILFSAIFLSSFASLLSIVALWSYDIISILSDSLFAGGLLLSAITKIAVLFYIWKKRDFLLGILTANRVRHVGNQLAQRFNRAGRSTKRIAKSIRGRTARPSQLHRQTSSSPAPGRVRAMRQLAWGATKDVGEKAWDRMRPNAGSKASERLHQFNKARRDLLNKKDKTANQLDTVRLKGMAKHHLSDREHVQSKINKRRQRIDNRNTLTARQKANNDLAKERLKKQQENRQDKRVVQDSPEVHQFKQERLAKHRAKQERKFNRKHYRQLQAQREHNQQTKNRLLERREERSRRLNVSKERGIRP